MQTLVLHFPILQFLRWSVHALAAGRMPEHRHDGHEWRPEDGDRQKAAGASIIKGALVLIKGDWIEYCLSLGFPTW